MKLSCCHTVVAAIEVSVAMAYSGVVAWVNGVHGNYDSNEKIEMPVQ